MKRFGTIICSLIIAAGTLAFAHEGNEHVRGVVTSVSASAITVEVSPKVMKTFTLTEKTIYTLNGKPAKLADIKVGARVVVDVPEKSTTAALVQIGVSAPVAPPAATTKSPVK